MDRTNALIEAITVALIRNNWKPILIAIPLSLAPRAANDVAARQFSIRTAEQMISNTYHLDEIEGKELIIYEYFPLLMTKDENELFMARLRTYRDCTNKTIVLFILLTQDSPIPVPSILKVAWTTDLFKKGELYEITTSWRQISLHRLKLVSFLDLILFGWRRKQIRLWETQPFEQNLSVSSRALSQIEA